MPGYCDSSLAPTLPSNAVAPAAYNVTVGSSTSLACDANYAAYPTNYNVNCVAFSSSAGAWTTTGGQCIRTLPRPVPFATASLNSREGVLA